MAFYVVSSPHRSASSEYKVGITTRSMESLRRRYRTAIPDLTIILFHHTPHAAALEEHLKRMHLRDRLFNDTGRRSEWMRVEMETLIREVDEWLASDTTSGTSMSSGTSSARSVSSLSPYSASTPPGLCVAEQSSSSPLSPPRSHSSRSQAPRNLLSPLKPRLHHLMASSHSPRSCPWHSRHALAPLPPGFTHSMMYGHGVVLMEENGYVNATQLVHDISSSAGTTRHRDLSEWVRGPSGRSLIRAVSRLKVIPENEVLISLPLSQSDPSRTQRGHAGTYVHPDLVPHIISWADPCVSLSSLFPSPSSYRRLDHGAREEEKRVLREERDQLRARLECLERELSSTD
jgi:hypothetical protein